MVQAQVEMELPLAWAPEGLQQPETTLLTCTDTWDELEVDFCSVEALSFEGYLLSHNVDYAD